MERESELLAIRCQLGEPEAFDELVERWHLPLGRYIRRMTGDEGTAEDVLQETWLGILRGIGRLREPSQLRAWLFTIARRGVMTRLRRQYEDAVLVPMEDELSGSDSIEEAWEDSAAVHATLAELPPPEKEVLALFYLAELDLREAAAVLQVPVGTVKSRLHRARRLMRERLEEKGVKR